MRGRTIMVPKLLLTLAILNLLFLLSEIALNVFGVALLAFL
jgi:hypothetical protein